MQPRLDLPPRDDELELSLFGPGYGECAVVHLGGGLWLVADSCPNEKGDGAIALDYLQTIGVDLQRNIKMVVATHWHDDHIRFLSQVVDRASSAKFVCSAALKSPEFLRLVSASETERCVERTMGASEFNRILEILKARDNGRYAIGPKLAASNQLLHRSGCPLEIEVWSLSPSDQAIAAALAEFTEMNPAPGMELRRFPSISPNDASVVLQIKTAGQGLLLGADMTRGGDEHRGWRAILSSQERPPQYSSCFKVSHHGSPNADHDEIWAKMLLEECRVAITPYARGRQFRPSNEDVERIKRRSNHVYCTAFPPTVSPPRRRDVDKTMNQVARQRRAVRKLPGHIRMRVPIRTDGATHVAVELFTGAVKL